MQRTEKRSAAGRATAGLAMANSRERNNGDGRLSARPKGAHRIGQFGVAALGKDLSHCQRAAPCLGRLGGPGIRKYHLDRVPFGLQLKATYVVILSRRQHNGWINIANLRNVPIRRCSRE